MSAIDWRGFALECCAADQVDGDGLIRRELETIGKMPMPRLRDCKLPPPCQCGTVIGEVFDGFRVPRLRRCVRHRSLQSAAPVGGEGITGGGAGLLRRLRYAPGYYISAFQAGALVVGREHRQDADDTVALQGYSGAENGRRNNRPLLFLRLMCYWEDMNAMEVR